MIIIIDLFKKWHVFYKSSDLSAAYIKNWSKHILPFATTFKWIELRDMLVWSSGDAPVQKYAHYLIEQNCLESKDLDQLFTEFSHIKAYLKSRPNIFNEWNENNTPIVDRWQNVFAHLKQQLLPFNVFVKLVEYVLVIPGKSSNIVCSDVTFIFIFCFYSH